MTFTANVTDAPPASVAMTLKAKFVAVAGASKSIRRFGDLRPPLETVRAQDGSPLVVNVTSSPSKSEPDAWNRDSTVLRIVRD